MSIIAEGRGETASSNNSLPFFLRKRNEIELRMEEIITEFVLLDGAFQFKLVQFELQVYTHLSIIDTF